MPKRFFSLLAGCLVMAAVMSACTSPEPAPPATGTVAQIPENIAPPALNPTSSPAPGPATFPAPVTSEPASTSTPAPEPTPATGPATATLPTTATAPTTQPVPTPPAKASPLTVLSVVGGEVLVMRAGADGWQPATAGMDLQPGDTIKSGSGSKAEITFFEGSTIELEASSQIVLSEISVADTGATTISLKQQIGRTISRVKKLTDTESRYEIETPAAVAAVRGSMMSVTVTSTGKTEVANLEGDIRVIVKGEEYIIHEGMKRSVIPGQAAGAGSADKPRRRGRRQQRPGTRARGKDTGLRPGPAGESPRR